METQAKINSAYGAMRIAFGVVPLLAGLDKFFNILTRWDVYVSPLVQSFLPMSATTFMHFIGIVEVAVGLAILTRWTRMGSYVAAAWLVGIALNLVMAGYLDIAVRDLVMAVGAYALARLSEVRVTEREPLVRTLNVAGIA
jgi:DoxX